MAHIVVPPHKVRIVNLQVCALTNEDERTLGGFFSKGISPVAYIADIQSVQDGFHDIIPMRHIGMSKFLKVLLCGPDNVSLFRSANSVRGSGVNDTPSCFYLYKA